MNHDKRLAMLWVHAAGVQLTCESVAMQVAKCECGFVSMLMVYIYLYILNLDM